MTKDIFISYASENKHNAEEMCSFLEPHWECWIAPRDILPGADYPESITTAIDTGKLFILILSQHSASSSHVSKELTLAVNRRKPVIAFKIEPVEFNAAMNIALRSVHIIDAYPLPSSAYFDSLKETIVHLLLPYQEIDSRSVIKSAPNGSDQQKTTDILPMKNSQEPEFAGFFRRFVASIADFIVIYIITGLLFYVYALIIALILYSSENLNSSTNPPSNGLSPDAATFWFLFIVSYIAYFALMDASSMERTLGKKVMGLITVDSEYKPLTMQKSLIRAIIKISPLLIFSVIIPFSKKKRAFHDIIIGSYVVKTKI